MKTKLVLATLLAALSGVSYGVESITGRVTVVEATYLPGLVVFRRTSAP